MCTRHLLLRNRPAKRVHVACLHRAAAADHLWREVTERPGRARACKYVRAAYCRVFGHVEVAEPPSSNRLVPSSNRLVPSSTV
jgi:hypothetical protein